MGLSGLSSFVCQSSAQVQLQREPLGSPQILQLPHVLPWAPGKDRFWLPVGNCAALHEQMSPETSRRPNGGGRKRTNHGKVSAAPVSSCQAAKNSSSRSFWLPVTTRQLCHGPRQAYSEEDMAESVVPVGSQ